MRFAKLLCACLCCCGLCACAKTTSTGNMGAVGAKCSTGAGSCSGKSSASCKDAAGGSMGAVGEKKAGCCAGSKPAANTSN